MAESISAAEANRQFSRLLRGVREEGATYIVTAHGRPVAKIVPIESDDEVPLLARKTSGGAERPAGGSLSLDQLWQRARALGSSHPSESAVIVREDRDAGHRR